MFELGLRLAFDKPTIIIKDDKTDYSFDTGVIEHIAYPRDLRFSKIVLFKNLLADKLVATHKAAKADPNHSTFLKNFGKFHLASLNQDEIPADRVVVEMFGELQGELSRLRRTLLHTERKGSTERNSDRLASVLSELLKYLAENPGARSAALNDDEDFISEMERRCAAPQYFDNRKQFRDTLDAALRLVPAGLAK
jgi:hypothetical protein